MDVVILSPLVTVSLSKKYYAGRPLLFATHDFAEWRRMKAGSRSFPEMLVGLWLLISVNTFDHSVVTLPNKELPS
jgi:hypothetical protein